MEKTHYSSAGRVGKLKHVDELLHIDFSALLQWNREGCLLLLIFIDCEVFSFSYRCSAPSRPLVLCWWCCWQLPGPQVDGSVNRADLMNLPFLEILFVVL